MTTARELIADALGDIGVLDPMEAMTAEQAQHGLRTLNRIIDSLNAQRLQVPAITEVVASFAGASASIGPGLTINTPHPLRLETGCYYVKSGISYPLPLWSREDYNARVLKGQSGDYPQGIYYDRATPGTVKVWPVPSVPIDYRLQCLVQLADFADLDTDYAFPVGYKDAFYWALCERLPSAYNLPVNPEANRGADKSRAVIRKNNTVVPVLDASLRQEGSRWNIYSN